MYYIKNAFKTLWDAVVFKGKASKEEYVIYIFFMILFPVCTYILLYVGLSFSIISSNIAYSLITLSIMSIIIPFFALPALTIRRLNDAGKSKLFALFLLLPIFVPNSFKLILWLIILIIFASVGEVKKKPEKIIKYDE
jgi:uncharacterized membrane protein YhaH (DUF805 family)